MKCIVCESEKIIILKRRGEVYDESIKGWVKCDLCKCQDCGIEWNED